MLFNNNTVTQEKGKCVYIYLLYLYNNRLHQPTKLCNILINHRYMDHTYIRRCQ